MKRFLVIVVSLFFSLLSYSQPKPVFNYIKDKSDISEGGSGVFEYKGTQYLISVAYLAVGTKNESDCKKVGAAKAKKEMLAYVNGTDITSYTELVTSEETIETISGIKSEYKQNYTESIKESVIGMINEINPLGGWYSEDGSVYYFAIYKQIN